MASWWTKDRAPRGEFDNEAVEDLDLDELPSDLDPPPYLEAPTAIAHWKPLPSLPSYEEVEAADSDKRDLVQKAVVSIITFLICFAVVFAVLFHYLSEDPASSHSKPDAIAINRPDRPSVPEVPTSRNGSLNLVQTYQQIDPEKETSECRAAWQSLTAVPCHETIFMTEWDDGTTPPPSLSLDRYVFLTCHDECLRALEEAHVSVGSACAGQEPFGTKDDAQEALWDPAKVVEVLFRRTQHACRKGPAAETERGFCMTDMKSRWDIIDGYQADRLQGLESFMQATQKPRTEPAILHIHKGIVDFQESDKWTDSYTFFRLERKYGPNRHSTSCSWCTYQWFEKKLSMWVEPPNLQGSTTSQALVTFLRSWEKAGRRCEGNRFDEIFQAAVQSYKNIGLLEDLWDRRPSGDIAYLISHGPSSGDAPIEWVKNGMIPALKTFRRLYGTPSSENAPQAHLVEEYTSCLETFVEAAQDFPCYPFLDFPQIKKHILSSPSTAIASCNENCFAAISTFASKVMNACPSARYARWKIYDQNLPSNAMQAKGFTLSKYFGDVSTLSDYQTACQTATGWKGIPCGAVYAKWGGEDWVFRERAPKPTDLIRITQQQLKQLPEMPEKLKNWPEILASPTITDVERAQAAPFNEWRAKMGEGVCSECMWRFFVPYLVTEEGILHLMPPAWWGEDVAMEWINTLHMMEMECRVRGVQFDLQELSAVDETWTKKYSPELMRQALSLERESPSWLTNVA